MTTILEEAQILVAGERRDDYGGIEAGMTATCDLWNAYLRNRPQGFEGISQRDVAILMILMKVSRLPFSMKRDTWVDIAGYARIGAVCDHVDDTEAGA